MFVTEADETSMDLAISVVENWLTTSFVQLVNRFDIIFYRRAEHRAGIIQ